MVTLSALFTGSFACAQDDRVVLLRLHSFTAGQGLLPPFSLPVSAGQREGAEATSMILRMTLKYTVILRNDSDEGSRMVTLNLLFTGFFAYVQDDSGR